MRLFILISLTFLSNYSLFSQCDSVKVMFYNAENLFDFKNDTLKNDNEFLPSSKKNWNRDKFVKKINRIIKVIAANNFPDIIGFSTPKIHFIRFDEGQLDDNNSEERFKNGGVEYLNKFNLPNFNPYPHFNSDKYVKSKDLISLKNRELENCMRIEKGLPKIGEGWISETTLFYEIKTRLKKFEVFHHGKPEWLGLQHFDIWIPSLNIAIEYQGAQHDRPVDFFGGKEAFKRNRERDKRKKSLCIENDVKLIEVREGYNIDNLINKIEELSGQIID